MAPRGNDRTLMLAAAAAACYLVCAAGWAIVAGNEPPHALSTASIASTLRFAIPGAAFASAGLLITANRTARAAGLALSATAVATILSQFATAWAREAAAGPTVRVAALILTWVCYLGLVLFQYTFPLCWPDGALPSRRWRWYVGAVALWCAPMVFQDIAASPLLPTPLAHGSWGSLADTLDAHLGTAWNWCPFALIPAATAVAALRAAGLPPARRRNVLLLLAAYLLWVCTQMATYYLSLPAAVNVTASVLVGLVWPIALAHVLTRERAWHLDRAARRVLVGFFLALLVLIGYLTAVALLSMHLPGTRTAGAAVLAGLAFLAGVGSRPLARWTGRRVERFYYGERAEPYRLLRTLAGLVGRASDPEQVPALLCRRIADALRLPGVALQARSRAGNRIQAEVGTFGFGAHSLDLVYQGEIVGRMRVGLRRGEDVLGSEDLEVLESLADQAAAAVSALRLYQDLQISAERLVVAQEEERRRLRRDIHDGLGPTLAALRLQADVLAGRREREPAEAARLRELSGGIAQAIAEVRRITDGLGPAALGELGLAASLEQLTRQFSAKGLAVASDQSGFRPGHELPAAVESAAYRIVAEALTNVVRHARAARAGVRLAADTRCVVLEVSDDGVGLPEAVRGGVGLASMAQRAAELGGTFQVLAAERGTHLRVTLPIAPAAG